MTIETHQYVLWHPVCYSTPLQFHIVLCDRHKHIGPYMRHDNGRSDEPCAICGNDPALLTVFEAAVYCLGRGQQLRVTYRAIENGDIDSTYNDSLSVFVVHRDSVCAWLAEKMI